MTHGCPILYFADKRNAAAVGASSKSEYESIDPVVAYHSLQAVAFAFLAGIIMRLKLLFTPQLCVLSALLCNYKVSSNGKVILIIAFFI